MNWFVWRQHRKQFLVFGILLALLAALLIPTGIHFWNTYQHALATCAQNPNTPSCSDLSSSLFTSRTDGSIRTLVTLAALGVPALVGLFLGAPLLAREYDEGTNKLAWTQSVSRRKWLSVKLMWILGFALVYGTALTLLVTWWSHTSNVLYQYRFVQGHFETQGLMPIAYSLFFTAIGFVTSAWFRKTLVAFAITFGVFVVCMASFGQLIRPHYMAPITVTAPIEPGNLDRKIPTGAWIISDYIVDGHGNSRGGFNLDTMPQQCRALTQNIQVPDGGHIAKLKAAGIDPVNDCLNQAGYRQIGKYQPAYRYWDFQRIEAGIYLGLAALAVAATYWLVLKRDA